MVSNMASVSEMEYCSKDGSEKATLLKTVSRVIMQEGGFNKNTFILVVMESFLEVLIVFKRHLVKWDLIELCKRLWSRYIHH